jgi:hypothetical protein
MGEEWSARGKEGEGPAGSDIDRPVSQLDSPAKRTRKLQALPWRVLGGGNGKRARGVVSLRQKKHWGRYVDLVSNPSR